MNELICTNPLKKIHEAKSKKISDKWELYLEVYQDIFYPLRANELSLLEVGVQNGGSLETWATYFPKSRMILGVDVDERCAQLEFEDARISVIIGDATKADTAAKISEMCSTWDIIIDDGSHMPYDVISSFALLFPMVAPGGLYIIEDTHTFYEPNPGAGILKGSKAQNIFKTLTDCVNLQFWGKDLDWRLFFEDLFPARNAPDIFDGTWIHSISFFNSMIVIKKERERKLDKLGKRLIRGGIQQVEQLDHLRSSKNTV